MSNNGYDPFDYFNPSGIGLYPGNIGFRAIGFDPGTHPYATDILAKAMWGWQALHASLADGGMAVGQASYPVQTPSLTGYHSAHGQEYRGALWANDTNANMALAFMFAEGTIMDWTKVGAQWITLLRYDPSDNTGYKFVCTVTATNVVTWEMFKKTATGYDPDDWVLIDDDPAADIDYDELIGLRFKDGAFWFAPLFHDEDPTSVIFVPGQSNTPNLNTLLVDPDPLIRPGKMGFIFYEPDAGAITAPSFRLGGIELGGTDAISNFVTEFPTETSAKPVITTLIPAQLLEIIVVAQEDTPNTPEDFSGYEGDYYEYVAGDPTFSPQTFNAFPALTALSPGTALRYAAHLKDATGASHFAYADFEIPTIISLADTGAGSDSISGITVTLGLSDTGAGADSLPGPGVTLGLTESGAGSDGVSNIAASFTLDDGGSGADALSNLAAQLTLIDNGAGVDATPIVAASLLLADSGSGIDTPNINAALTVTDSGSGADVVSVLSELLKTITDSGLGSDAISLSASLAITDAGAGSDAVNIAVTLQLTDTGVGNDTVSLLTDILKTITDTGIGSDTVSGVTVQTAVTDAGAGSDVAGIAVSLAVVDSAIAVDQVFAGILIALADSGVGGDSISIGVQAAVMDSGSGNDAITAIAVALQIVDSAGGTDSVVVFSPTDRVAKIRFTLRGRSMVLTLSGRSAKFTLH